MPIHRKAFPMGIFKHVASRFLYTRHRIELVHSHSRRAHWVAAQAAKLTGISHVTTIHQRFPCIFSPPFFLALGDQRSPLMRRWQTTCERHFKRSAQQVHLIRNGINFFRRGPVHSSDPEYKNGSS